MQFVGILNNGFNNFNFNNGNLVIAPLRHIKFMHFYDFYTPTKDLNFFFNC